ncbi:MAG: SpoIIE family protein phosphatase [Candidatus Riflebacteria bacterium]|nr:SpoIIE family protein phosphatase [Candidatus Riflebacteria bacterium]
MSPMKKTFKWLAFIICFAGIPGLLLYLGIVHTHNQNSRQLLDSQRIKISRFYQGLQKFADPQHFWCTTFMEALAPDTIVASDAARVIINRVKELRQNLKFNYVVYTPKKGVLFSSQPLEPVDDWRLALSLAWKIISRDGPKPTKEHEQAGGKIFGPQLNWDHFENNFRVDNLYLVWADSTFKKPLIWGRVIHKHMVLAFIEYKDLDASEGIWNLLKDFARKSDNRLSFSLQDGTGSLRNEDLSERLIGQVQQAADEYERGKSQQITTRDLIVFPFFLRPGATVFGHIQKSVIYGHRLPAFTWVFTAFFLLASLGLIRYSWLLIFKEQPDQVSLRWKLRFLFFFANGLPLLVLFFIGNDYLVQKRSNLLQETLGKSISFIQDFDEKIEVEYARRLTTKEKAQKKLIDKLSLNIEDFTAMQQFIDSLGSQSWKVLMVASRSSAIVTEKGVYDDTRKLAPPDEDKGIRGERNRNQNEFTLRVGQFFLDKINGVPVSEKVETELELFIESTTQKPLANFLFNLLQKRGSFVQWGFGQNVDPAIFDTFSLKNSKKEDIFFLSSFRSLEFQHSFLISALTQANRNSLGLKILAVLDPSMTVPREAYKNLEVREFATTLTSYPNKEIKLIDYQGQRYLATGIAGRHIKDFKLIGLFPLEKIDSVISSQRRNLLAFALLSLLMTWGLSQVLAQSFISPLNQITTGAQAIENKHFSHRLPDLGRDEFGAMGRVFNAVMVDLEELSVASAIQEQLLPHQQIETGFFSLFGRSVSMGELGGDYYDHISLENGKFSVLLGDVAGHGVGAALIMAMAKAGIIQSEHLLAAPQQLLNRLHGLIYASKTKKQKKIMTFQYLYLDGQSGQAVYSNAGACSPMIIRKSNGLVEELTLTGAALGAFKKPNYSEVELIFQPGDAIVFYTDGIVEARNRQGEELGYDRLRQLLLESWDIDAETFYNNIFNAYLQHLGDEGAQDDLTMVVLVYDPRTDQTETPALNNAGEAVEVKTDT